MERAAQRFALQDKNGDGVLSVAEKEANLAKLAGVMQQAGKPVPERMSQLKPSRGDHQGPVHGAAGGALLSPGQER